MVADEARKAARQEKRRQLNVKFLNTACMYARELTELIEHSSDRRPEGEKGQRFRKLAHDLRGSGAAYGFMVLSECAGRVENAYMEAASGPVLRSGVQDLEEAVRVALAERTGSDCDASSCGDATYG